MAASGTSLERHVAAIIVVVDIYPQIMKEMVINSWPPATTAQTVQPFCKHPFVKSLHDSEKGILGTLATDGYSRCDVSLMYKLIRQFNLVETPTKQWGNQPSPEDVNQGDDVERMRRNRNEILHRSRGSLSEKEKETFFQESEGIARRIDQFVGCSNNGFEYRINSLRSCIVTREKYVQVLEKFNKLRERLQNLPGQAKIDLYYDNIIASIIGNVGDPNGETNCTLYIRDSNMNISKVVQILDEFRNKLNEGKCEIRYRGAEDKCLAVHIQIDNECFKTKELLHKAVESFLHKLLKFTSLDEILTSPVDVILAESDNIYDMEEVNSKRSNRKRKVDDEFTSSGIQRAKGSVELVKKSHDDQQCEEETILEEIKTSIAHEDSDSFNYRVMNKATEDKWEKTDETIVGELAAVIANNAERKAETVKHVALLMADEGFWCCFYQNNLYSNHKNEP